MGVSASRDAGPPPQQQHTLAARTLHPGSAGPGPGSCRNCRDLSSPTRGSEAETHASSFPASSTARSLGMASMRITENRGKRPAITRTHRGHVARLRSRGKKAAFVLDEVRRDLQGAVITPEQNTSRKEEESIAIEAYQGYGGNSSCASKPLTKTYNLLFVAHTCLSDLFLHVGGSNAVSGTGRERGRSGVLTSVART